MTGCTVVDDALMFKPGISKGSRSMAYRAILGDGDVRRVGFGGGAGCVDTIVAGRTVIDDTGVIEYSRCKGSAGHVTDAAILGGYHMGRIDLRIFASGGGTVMAGIAARGQHDGIAVIDKRVGKTNRVMAKSAIVSGSGMWRCGCLPPGTQSSKAAIVAGHAITGDTLVRQHRSWCESGYRMASITILASWHMAYCFYQ